MAPIICFHRLLVTLHSQYSCEGLTKQIGEISGIFVFFWVYLKGACIYIDQMNIAQINL